MQQLYALMTQPMSDKLADRFPNAIDCDNKKLGVFVDSERDMIESLGNVDILTYEQAKELVDKERKDELDI